jgi:monoamine oxidase
MKVAVVGMGAAGIQAALLLEQAGIETRLFEARDRVGGRLYTVEGPDGLLYDAGGEWIDADHTRILEMARSIGVEPEPTPRWPGIVCYRGEMCNEHSLWSDALEDELRLEAAAEELARNMNPVPWDNEHLASFDDVTLAQFIDEQAQSERGKWWLRRRFGSDEGDDVERIGLLGWLAGYRMYLNREPDSMSAYRLSGGMGRLFERVAQTLKTPIHFEMALRRVINDGNRVILQFDDGEATVDHAILCLPPPALERICFDPALPPTKRCAIEACEMSRTIKISLQFKTKWWERRKWSGSLICDLPIQQTWDGTKGEVPVLNCYIGGRDADHFLTQTHPVPAALHQLAEIFPEAKDEFVNGILYDWVRDTFAMGSFSHLAPGYVLQHMKFIAEPLGRIHFAGEHTASWVGFIEGALESGERAVGEILERE